MIDKEDYMYMNDVYDCYVFYCGEVINIVQYEFCGGNFKFCEKDDLVVFLDYCLNKIFIVGDLVYM